MSVAKGRRQFVIVDRPAALVGRPADWRETSFVGGPPLSATEGVVGDSESSPRKQSRIHCGREGTGNPSLEPAVKLWFEAKLVIHGESELLLTAEVTLRRLYGYVTEKELNLVEFAAGQMAETRTVRRRSWGASLSIPAAAAALFTISKSTFGVTLIC